MNYELYEDMDGHWSVYEGEVKVTGTWETPEAAMKEYLSV